MKLHLKNENTFDKDVKDKIFFIGQNALKGQSIETQAPMISQFKKVNRAKMKLSKNTMKTIERMQA